MTTQSPPVTTVDDADNKNQRRSYDGLNSTDTQNIETDTTSPADGSDTNFEVPTESKKSPRASDVKDKIPYQDIVYDDHDNVYTKRFEEEDQETLLRSESEKSGEVSVRPLRLTPIGREQESTEFDKKFRRYAKKHDLPLHFLQDNPKESMVISKGKRTPSKSHSRYEHYKTANTFSEFMTSSLAGRPKGQSLKKARSTALADFIWDYERGFIIFPGNESCLPGHIFDARQLAKDNQLPCQSDLLFDSAKVCKAMRAAIDNDDEFDSDLFEKALLMSHTVEPDNIFLDHRATLMAYAESISRKLLMQDPETKTFHETPKNMRSAVNGPDKDKWLPSMKRELDAMKRKDVWEEVTSLPLGTIPLPCMFTYKLKSDKSGFISEWKSRLVALGNLAKEGIHYSSDEISSSVFSYDSLRTVISLATGNNWKICQLDISNAYLNAPMKDEVFLRHPLKETTPDGLPIFLKLKRSIYGLAQSGYNWAQLLHGHLKSGGFEQSIADTCMFRLKTTRGELDPNCPEKDRNMIEEILVGTYVDDCVYAGSSDFILNWFKSYIASKFEVKQSESGPLEWILGARVYRDIENGTTTINQSVAIEKLARKLDLLKSNPCKSPMTPTPLPLPDREKRPPPEFDYLSVIGSLLHIVNYTRPDCAFAVSYLARHSATYDKSYVDATKRVVKYLFHTRHMGITYFREREGFCTNEPVAWEAGSHPLDWKQDPNERLKLFTDASFGNDISTKRSTSGEIIFLNGGPISWFARLQKLVALSTAESEIYAAIDGTKVIAHLKVLLSDLGARDNLPVTTYQDNRACIIMGSQLRNHRNARHYVTRLSYLQQQVTNGTIKFCDCHTNDQLADGMTKPLPDEPYLQFSRAIVPSVHDLYPSYQSCP